MIHIDWITLVRPATGTHERVPAGGAADTDEAAGTGAAAPGKRAVVLNGWRAISGRGRPGKHLWYSGYWLQEKEGMAFAGVGTTNGEPQEVLVLSGALAEKWADYAIDQGGWRATRIDLQITVQESVNIGELIAAHRAAFARIKSTDICGQTLYIGSRTGERFWRIYNKAAQLRDLQLEPLWRWELELKGKRAQLAWELLTEENSQETRYRLMYHNRIGIVKEHFPVLPDVAEPLPALPRTRDTEEEFARKTVIPFLRDKPHIRAIIRKAMDMMDEE
jgi:hypothetical protein